MSKELYFTDGNNEVKYLDTTASFNLAITQDGSAFDLTNATAIDVKVANDTGYVFTKSIDMATIKQPLAGLITMPVDAEVMNALVPDDYTIEVWVTLSSLITPGSQEGLTDDGSTTNTTTSTTTYNAIFPSDDPQGFTITENVMSDSGDVIPVMSLDEFQQEFDQLKTDLTNQVSTLQGPKGDPGEGLDIKGQVNSVSALPTTATEGDGYLVNEELYVWTNGAWKDCGLLQGPQGIQGKTGTGVSSTTIQYQISNSATTTPTGTWSNTLIATTQDNPFLWTQATLNYDDGTSKSFYLVSSKGDKGDKGDTGDIGPVGPVGPVGAGLVVKGTVSNASQLPTTGNQEGYCYFVGTDLYVWDAGAWKNCGNVSPDLSKYVTVTDLNNGLNTKVTDNKNGTEQLNGVQVQPFNKLSDTIGGRNLFLNSKAIDVSYARNRIPTKVTVEPFDSTTNMWHIVSEQGTGSPNGIYLPDYANGKIPDNSDWSYSVDIKGTGKVLRLGIENTSINQIVGTVGAEWSRISQTGRVDTPTSKTIVIYFDTDSSPLDVYIKLPKLEIGNMPTDWTPAPEDKVNVSDMRKPASDVVGLEDITQTALPDGTDFYTLLNTAGRPLQYFASNYAHAQTMINKPTSALSAFILITSSVNNRTTTSYNYTFFNLRDVSTGDSYEALIHTDGTGKITVIRPWHKIADDSKVAHLSGANNFDTTPTVNNNPLLLASSLPSDLARTSQQTNFTAGLQSNGKAVATTSDVTTAINTATANMVDSTKATNFTAGLQSGGVNVATAADLKSVADKAWYQLDNKYITSTYTVSYASTVLYKIDDTNKRLYLQGGIILTSNITDVDAITLNLGSIVKKVLSFNGVYLGYDPSLQNWTSISSSTGLTFSPRDGLVQFSGDNRNAWISTGPLYITYDELV